jgi:hypothetical protein
MVAKDWSDYDTLFVRVAMSGAPEPRITVELSDGPHPGFRIQHLVGGDPVSDRFSDVRFPIRGVRDVPGRPDLDRGRIEKIWILGKHKGTSATLRLDKIWLE